MFFSLHKTTAISMKTGQLLKKTELIDTASRQIENGKAKNHRVTKGLE